MTGSDNEFIEVSRPNRDTVRYVIFHADNARAQADEIPVTGEFWTPSLEQALELEARLPAYLKELLGDKYADTIYYDLEDYPRQYVGFEKDGEKLIWVNVICALTDFLILYGTYIFIGSGDCNFRLIYHPKTQTFSDFKRGQE